MRAHQCRCRLPGGTHTHRMRKPETIAFWFGRLPHWEVVDGRYFITLHLAGAIPRQAGLRIRSISNSLSKLPTSNIAGRLKVQRRIFSEMEFWLDRSNSVAYLTQPRIAKMIHESIEHRNGCDWHMFDYVVMPNHLHLFCELRRKGLKSVIEDFKRWTGHKAIKLLNQSRKRFGQDEWFDHWSRSDEEDDKIVQYIHQNPVKTGLVRDFRDWPHGSWSKHR
jgi:putative transposase